MTTIYDITNDFYALNNLMNESMTDSETGEVRELSEDELADFMAWLDENKQNLEAKFNSIYKVWRNIKAEAEIAEAEKNTLKSEIDRLGKRAKARENETNRVKNLFAYAMERLNMKKYKTALFSIGFQNTRKTARPIEGFFNPDDIPVEFLKRELSSTAIYKAVEEGRLYEKDDPISRGSLFYKDGNGKEQKLKGIAYLGGTALVIR